eukprot:SAG31_NODE_332_length_17516_cov_3.552840_4_plen_548_part_00
MTLLACEIRTIYRVNLAKFIIEYIELDLMNRSDEGAPRRPARAGSAQRMVWHVTASLFLTLIPASAVAQNCTKCPGGSGQTCCGRFNVCCKGDGWSCISKDESCCAGTACIRQTTYCCPPTTDPSCPNGKCPARCCPRWTVCCSKGGRDGCCHPLEAEFMRILEEPSNSTANAATPPNAAAAIREPMAKTHSVVFAMFLEAEVIAEPLKVLTIDMSTGHHTSKVVHGYDTHGENTRLFEFNRATGRFVTFENDFSQTPIGPDRLLPVYMYSVSPVDGTVTKTLVTKHERRGAAANGWLYPTGYKYDAKREMMVLAVGPAPTGDRALPSGGFTFYSVDGGGHATVLSSTPGPPSPVGLPADPLAGWMHALSPSGIAYRFGFMNVSAGANFGLGNTNTTTAASSFSHRALPSAHATYLSLDADDDFRLFSMAPRSGVTTAIDLVQWSGSDKQPINAPKVVAVLGDAHQPSLFGDVGAAMYGKTWVGLTVQHPGIVVSGGWALSVVANVSSSAASKLLPLKPRVAGGTCSLAGIAIGTSEFAGHLSDNLV